MKFGRSLLRRAVKFIKIGRLCEICIFSIYLPSIIGFDGCFGACFLRRIDANSIGFKNRFAKSNLNFRSNLRRVLPSG